jgi:hypothetical protein
MVFVFYLENERSTESREHLSNDNLHGIHGTIYVTGEMQQACTGRKSLMPRHNAQK